MNIRRENRTILVKALRHLALRTKSAYERWLKYRAVFNRELDRLRYGSDYRKKHIVLCGFPRSGTSLFYNMLCATLCDFNFDEWEHESSGTISQYDNHASKSPLDILRVENILASNIHDKDVYFIVLVRDLRDVITSFHPNVPEDYFIGYEGGYSVYGNHPNYRVAFDSPGIGQLCAAIENLQRSDHNAIVVKYEDLVSDPNRVQASLKKTFGLEFQRTFGDYHLYPESHGIKFEREWGTNNPSMVKSSEIVSTSYVSRWCKPEHRDRIINQFSDHPELFSVLLAYGYERDNTWFDEFRNQKI